jgi:hypothetical protein
MICPFSEEELAIWDGVENPLGDICNECKEECEHNSNHATPEEIAEFELYLKSIGAP